MLKKHSLKNSAVYFKSCIYRWPCKFISSELQFKSDIVIYGGEVMGGQQQHHSRRDLWRKKVCYLLAPSRRNRHQKKKKEIQTVRKL